MKRTILFVGGGLETVPGIRTAREMGLHTVVSDYDPEAPGFEAAHDRLLASTYDVEETLAAARRYHREERPLHGVICLAVDVPLTVARVAEELDLPGIPPELARLATDKLAMKDYFSERGIPVPRYRPVESSGDLKNLIAGRGYPHIVKPVDSRGARGVLRLTEEVDLGWAFEQARSHSPSGRVMAEEYLEGPQVSTESLVIGGEACTTGFSDRNYEFLEKYAPHIIENGGDLPSFLPEADQKKIRELVSGAVRSLGIENGVVKGDIVLSGGEPYIIELAFRMSGGYFCTHEIPMNTGVNFVKHAIRVALGEEVDPADLEPRYLKNVCQRYYFPDPGTVTEVRVPGWAENDPQVGLCEVRVEEGDEIPPPTHHPARAGVVIVTGESREDARERARRLIEETVIATK